MLGYTAFHPTYGFANEFAREEGLEIIPQRHRGHREERVLSFNE
jgi:hypothetical protein